MSHTISFNRTVKFTLLLLIIPISSLCINAVSVKKSLERALDKQDPLLALPCFIQFHLYQ